MKKTRFIACMLVLTSLLISLTGCGGSSGTSESATPAESSGAASTAEASGGENQAGASDPVKINVGIRDPLGGFLPGSPIGYCYPGLYLVYDYMFYADVNTNELYSYVLTDWYYVDELTLVLKLKEGITFSNGDPMTAEDLLYSVTNYNDREAMKSGFFTVFNKDTSYVQDDLTLVLKTDEPYGPGLTNLALTPILNEKWAQSVGWDSESWIKNPVGSGPYEVAEYVTDSYVRLIKRDDYWGAQEYPVEVDEFVIKYYAEDTAMFIELETGALDIALAIPELDYKRTIAGVDGIGVKLIPTKENLLMCLGAECNEFMADVNVRKAIAYGVDWEDIGIIGYGEMYSEPSSILHKDANYYKNVGTYEYNPDYARQILQDAGYSDGDIKFTFVHMPVSYHTNMAEAVKYYMNEIGIDVDLQSYDFATVAGMWVQPGGTDFNFQELGSGSPAGEPYESLEILMPSGPFPVNRVADDKFVELMNKALYTTDTKVREAAYAELQQHVYDNYLVIPIAEGYGAVAYRTDVVSDVNFNHAVNADLRNITLAGN